MIHLKNTVQITHPATEFSKQWFKVVFFKTGYVCQGVSKKFWKDDVLEVLRSGIGTGLHGVLLNPTENQREKPRKLQLS